MRNKRDTMQEVVSSYLLPYAIPTELSITKRTFALDWDKLRWIALFVLCILFNDTFLILNGDKIGELLAGISLMPFAILVGFATLILFRRDLHTIFFAAGMFINEAINWITKHWIKETRPCAGNREHWVEFGMPSSHAQFMWFFTLYIMHFLFVRLNRPSPAFASREACWKILVLLSCFATSLLISYGRIYLGYHHWRQVIYGGILGAISGSLWFCFVHFAASSFFPWIASLRISELLMIRDCTPIPNIMFFEYSYTRLECRKRNRKSSFHRK